MTSPLARTQILDFHRDGFVFARGFLDREEVELLRQRADRDRAAQLGRASRDASGRESRLLLWNHPPEGLYGTISRSARLVRSMDMLLGEESYHWHSKMMMKEPRVGGAWEWHQDYGYWYGQCLRPDLASCFIAVDAATRTNGCLQVLRGSHHYGRIEHGNVGAQTGANPGRVAAIADTCERVYAELAPGDAVFFHSNALHRSDANESEHSRWGYICCFNARSNSPTGDQGHGHPPYTPLAICEDHEIKRVGYEESGRHRD